MKNRYFQIMDDVRHSTVMREKTQPPPKLPAPGSHPGTSAQERTLKSAPALWGAGVNIRGGQEG